MSTLLRCLPLGLIVLIGWIPSEVRAEDWAFRRSYFSHMPPVGMEPQHPVPESRSAYRAAYYREAAGFSVRSAFRVNNYVIQNGNRYDRTFYREGYVEFDP